MKDWTQFLFSKEPIPRGSASGRNANTVVRFEAILTVVVDDKEKCHTTRDTCVISDHVAIVTSRKYRTGRYLVRVPGSAGLLIRYSKDFCNVSIRILHSSSFIAIKKKQKLQHKYKVDVLLKKEDKPSDIS